MGECLAAQQHFAEAEPLLLTGYDDLQKRLASEYRQTVEANHCLQDFYLAWNKPGETARSLAVRPPK